MFPPSPFRTSSIVAPGLPLRKARVATTKPGVQKPHCVASCFTKHVTTSSTFVPSPNPSTVVIFLPTHSTASLAQAYVALPSIITVQAPQLVVVQTSFAPVRLRSSRRTSSSVTRGSTVTVCDLPLMSSLTGAALAATRFFSVFFSWASDSSTVATMAVAATAAPEPLRKSRRLKPGPLRGCSAPASLAPDELLVSRIVAPLPEEMSAKPASIEKGGWPRATRRCPLLRRASRSACPLFHWFPIRAATIVSIVSPFVRATTIAETFFVDRGRNRINPEFGVRNAELTFSCGSRLATPFRIPNSALRISAHRQLLVAQIGDKHA